jgi:hypothetical protein
MTLANRAIAFSEKGGVAAILLLASVVLNVALARRIHSQQLTIRYLETEEPGVGTSVVPITAKTLDGSPATITFNSGVQRTVVYVFSPSCHWCARNLSNLRTLSNGVGASYRLVGLSLSREGVAEYIAKNDIRFPVYTEPDNESKIKLKLASTPDTIAVDSTGKIVGRWTGAWSDDRKEEVETFFGLKLPGLASEAHVVPAHP